MEQLLDLHKGGTMKKFIIIFCFAFLLTSCSANKTKITNEQLLSLKQAADYTEEYCWNYLPNDMELLNSIIMETNSVDLVNSDNLKETGYVKIVDEIINTYGLQYSKSKAIDEAKRYTYYLRLKALLVTDNETYETEFLKIYPLYCGSKYSKYAYSLSPKHITLTESQFNRVSNSYEALLTVYTNDVDQWVILSELSDLYSYYEEYEYPKKFIDLSNKILDRHGNRSEVGRDVDDDFLNEIQNYNGVKTS